MDTYDVVVIGAGPAGYVAAIRCAQLGLKTACVDDWLNEQGEPSPGGTCLNVGCIPSKVLLESTRLYQHAQTGLAEHGIVSQGVSMQLDTLLARKQRVVGELTGGVRLLLQANGVTLISGRGKLLAADRVEVSHNGNTQTLSARHVILAPGSRPREHKLLPVDQERIVDSTGALAFEAVPESLAVIGAGVIGLELGSVWQRLGSKVHLFKTSGGFLSAADRDLAEQLRTDFAGHGFAFHFESYITGCKVDDQGVTLEYKTKEQTFRETFDRVLVAIGRVPNTEDLFASQTGLQCDPRGFIKVDEQCRTSLANVYAIGDAVPGPMLAHKGSEEGLMVASLIAGQFAEVNHDTIPFVIYTHPEVAWVGATEQALQDSGRAYRVGNFSFAANGRARAIGETTGLIKVLADAQSDQILGVHIIGPQAAELISQAVQAMNFGASSEDIALTLFAHPSLSEVLHEAAMDVNLMAIHKARPR